MSGRRTSEPAIGHLLVSAYACDPTNGSEPGVGWQVLRATLGIAEHVTVLTRANNADDIREALPPDARCTVLVHDLDPWSRWKKRLPFGLQLYYLAWQITARRVVENLHHDRPIDLAHHVTIATDWLPTAISTLPADVATVWGPVGGTTRTPAGMKRFLGVRGCLAEHLRSVTGALGRRAWGRRAAARARLTVAQNPDVSRYFARVATRMTSEPNAFIDAATLPRRTFDDVDRFRIVGVGRLVDWKGWALAVDVLAALPADYRLEIFGTGPDESRLRRRARRAGVDARLILRGWQPRGVVLDAVARAGCLLHPSLHDSAPGAVAEALTMGTPVACLDVGGSGALSTESGGIAVPARSRTCVSDLADAVRLAVEPHSPHRWSVDRLPSLLTTWYREARLDTAPGGA